MEWLRLIVFLPLIVDIVKAVEKLVEGANQGMVKKEMVMTAISSIVNLASGVGVVKSEDVVKIMSVVGVIVDQIVMLLNESEVFSHGR